MTKIRKLRTKKFFNIDHRKVTPIEPNVTTAAGIDPDVAKAETDRAVIADPDLQVVTEQPALLDLTEILGHQDVAKDTDEEVVTEQAAQQDVTEMLGHQVVAKEIDEQVVAEQHGTNVIKLFLSVIYEFL
jgi:hypothetical protein